MLIYYTSHFFSHFGLFAEERDRSFNKRVLCWIDINKYVVRRKVETAFIAEKLFLVGSRNPSAI